ncbi:helix-turn-helix domain-containing protein [Clostridioides sp. ES-S-0108-01]|uniref:AraC family transcriptional regulator n=1 Tax=unclassified Clostridioides TaxID=2635829 RepID=UPI001D0C031E|nr:helix-turn-helix transcriptional regulator [Clostridioides sp. ES-S-0171-01]MCC0688328.1 helix-turn-helix transcriptional regulator [Clostridioides sp. ES-S-0056-01]MCC0715621.1 helix-turn-helix transcriptional regulator [Clostridioides sp. ES-S-0077-01]MCC0782521.1 helix-turn-helix domain-containing protein [Clostridioides sp. ES-S-0108-01]UDN50924.1 helix-turn-helix domain-containing protein [Clostridioides sp. ES-S-0107-01]UDN54425.1 helix-turn-helix domain-containing protein [Clostridio
MKRYIHNMLSEITEEEKNILEGNYRIDKSIYTDNSQFIIDSNKLLNIGELIHIRKHTRFIQFPKHKHNYIEFNYVYKGKLVQTIDEYRINLKQGELIFLNQHVIHEIEASDEEDIIINFIIKPEFFNYIISLLENDNSIVNFLMTTLYTNYDMGEYLYFKVSDKKEIQDIIENIVIELYEPSVISKVKIKLLVGLLLVELVKNSEDVENHAVDNYEKMIIIEVLKYVDRDYKKGSLTEVASNLKQSDYKISKLVKKHLGYTFKDLVQEKRLSKACELLLSTNLSIAEIIESVGYENLTYFYKIFKNRYGFTPKEYKENIKNSQ